ncbi:hypothetical protein H2O64_00945 [Kordia sp. YSTF-M3]|uniref:Cytochrome c domain-containing protein n=1 Tax=Kordia aestuariivivens TaxID=2759037 RepID=A0ABR7Q3U3_9FLAO|nr:hypothetical protein [Kordia aestuariivivens]MBC8753215.1 hypothetical protein [Kordia aestuariivivens]
MKNLLFKGLSIVLILAFIMVSCEEKKDKEKYKTTTNDAGAAMAQIVLSTPINSKLPTDVLQSCTVSNSDFNSWFASKTVSENGAVNAANSVTAVHNNNCDFYKWSEQMFLWITSPNTSGDYSSGTVMESDSFYTVSTSVDDVRTLIPHEEGKLISAVANAQKNDGLFVDTEEGQATDDVLMAQNGSLIYYISMVNDVYAQYLNGVANSGGSVSGSEFPTTQDQLNTIIAFAATQGITVKDPNTLTIEIKTSWVDADQLTNADDYITMNAIVPTYDTSNDQKWVPNGTGEKKLAMIGIHIVGTIDGHPEMVWATFEHVNNAPNLEYTYLDTESNTKTQAADTGNDWLLNSDSSNSTYNQSHMIFCNSDELKAKKCDELNTIVAKDSNTISASNTKMTKPWGAANEGAPNAENDTPAASNSEVISINNSVLGQLVAGDLRKNYIFIGATWTDGGAAPDGTSYSSTNTAPGVAIGTSQLANSTMETYAQNGASYALYGTCFSCHHSASPGLKPSDLSHIYSELLKGESK